MLRLLCHIPSARFIHRNIMPGLSNRWLIWGIDSLCIKDMAGLLTPVTAKELVQSIKRDNDIKIEMHTHCTVGTGQLAYLGALEAGADIFDTATAPLSGASSQPPVEAMYQSFKNTRISMYTWMIHCSRP